MKKLNVKCSILLKSPESCTEFGWCCGGVQWKSWPQCLSDAHTDFKEKSVFEATGGAAGHPRSPQTHLQ